MTEKGRSVRPQLEKALSEVIEVLNIGLSEEEQDMTRKLFRRILNNITQVSRDFKSDTQRD